MVKIYIHKVSPCVIHIVMSVPEKTLIKYTYIRLAPVSFILQSQSLENHVQGKHILGKHPASFILLSHSLKSV